MEEDALGFDSSGILEFFDILGVGDLGGLMEEERKGCCLYLWSVAFDTKGLREWVDCRMGRRKGKKIMYFIISLLMSLFFFALKETCKIETIY